MSTNSNTYNPEELKQQILTAIENPAHDKRYGYSVCGYRNGYIDTPSKEPKKDEVPETPRDIEKQVNIRERKLENVGLAATYTLGTNKITMNKYNYSVKDFPDGAITKENLRALQNSLNNPYTESQILFHEINHYLDYQINGMSDIQTPIDIARSNRFTETKSHAVGYLSTAMTYTFHKNQGIETIEMDGKEVPLETIFKACPGLEEILKDKDFDPNNPEMVRRIVEASSRSWHEEAQETYDQQAKNIARSVDYETTYQSDLKRAKDPRTDEQIYDDFVTKALQNVYIGTNTCVDLSNCRDLLDTMSIEEAKNLTVWSQSDYDYNKSIIPPKETLLAVDEYLESIGITDEREKAKYLKKQIAFIASRNPDYDSQLKSIITQHGGEIEYCDGIIEEYNANGEVFRISKGPTTIDIVTPTKQELRKEIKNDAAIANETFTAISATLQEETASIEQQRTSINSSPENNNPQLQNNDQQSTNHTPTPTANSTLTYTQLAIIRERSM